VLAARHETLRMRAHVAAYARVTGCTRLHGGVHRAVQEAAEFYSTPPIPRTMLHLALALAALAPLALAQGPRVIFNNTQLTGVRAPAHAPMRPR
jgi:hypothetical protein